MLNRLTEVHQGREGEGRAGVVAVVCAVAMIAHQVAGKATRDALFLESFSITALPTMLAVASVLAVVVVLVAAKGMRRWGPGGVVRGVCGVSAVLSVGEWGMSGVEPGVAAVVVYLHTTTLSAVLISGFWSVVAERFDPQTARHWIGRIAAGATLGGLVGGVIAERVAAWLSVESMLLALAFLHGLCAVLVGGGGLLWSGRVVSGGGDEGAVSARKVLWGSAYLKRVGALVIVGTMSAALLDYVFKERASEALTNGEDLLRFFAIFYTLSGVATFVVQAILSGRLLERVGMTAAVASLPAAVVVGCGGALAWPGLISASLARGVEMVARSSSFRSGYEMLYLPLPAAERRATKLLVDVGCDRLGDALGAGLVMGALAVSLGGEVMLLVGCGMGVVGVALTKPLRRGYVEALERNLVDRAAHWSPSEEAMQASTPWDGSPLLLVGGLGGGGGGGAAGEGEQGSGVLRTTVQPHPPSSAPQAQPSAEFWGARAGSLVVGEGRDPLLVQIALLRSGDLIKIQEFLSHPPPLDRALIAHLVPLLARGRLSGRLIEVLRAFGGASTGQLVDVLLDAEAAFVVRRRLPRVLVSCANQRAVDGLVGALKDARFEVRFHSARALALLVMGAPGLVLDPRWVWRALEVELKADAARWRKRRLIDPVLRSGEHPLDDVWGESPGPGLMHVFMLLALVLPGPPLRASLIGVRAADRALRGTALEYLESVLPPVLWGSLKGLLPALVYAPQQRQAGAAPGAAPDILNIRSL